jgi:hypothetical protein
VNFTYQIDIGNDVAIDDKSLKGNGMPSLTVIISGTDIDTDLVKANTHAPE